MDPADHRQLVSLLASDLAWLEDHCRRQPALAREAGQIRLAAAFVRNVIGPYLDSSQLTPVHIAVVGGAGAGKSTIVNFLVGAAVAEANPQAGYTRHPTAYVAGDKFHRAGAAILAFSGPCANSTSRNRAIWMKTSTRFDAFQRRRRTRLATSSSGIVRT